MLKLSNTVKSDDIEELIRIADETGVFSDASIHALKAMLNISSSSDSKYKAIVAYDEKPIGCILYSYISDTDRTYKIYYIFVDKNYRHNHVANNMMKLFEETISDENATKIVVELSSSDKHESARKFFENYGYINVSEIKGYFSNEESMIEYVKDKTRRGVAIVYTEVSDEYPEYKAAIKNELYVVENAIASLGYSTVHFEYTSKDIINKLKERNVNNVVNLVRNVDMDYAKSIDVQARLLKYGIRCTGDSLATRQLISDKVALKKILRRKFINCSALIEENGYYNEDKGTYNMPTDTLNSDKCFIIKPANGIDSIDITEDNVVRTRNFKDVTDKIKEFTDKYNTKYMAETFIPGDEYSVALVEINGEMKALNPARIHFKNESKIMTVYGYNAKWNKQSDEYNNIEVTFDVPDDLKTKLVEASEEAARILGLEVQIL